MVGVSDKLHIEVKRYAKFGIWKYIEQMRRDAKDGQIPVLQLRPNGDKDWYVAISMDKLIEFCNEVVRLERENDVSSTKAACDKQET